LCWTGILLGLAFTMTNVQQFAAHGAPTRSLIWLSAWLLDPMVSLVLIGVLLAEQITSRWQVDTPRWATTTKCFALAATYVMNTWQPWFSLSASGIVLHSVPPLLVFTAVEGGPAMRDALTTAVGKSLTASVATLANAAGPTPTTVHESVYENAHGVVHDSVREDVHDLTRESAREPLPAPVREPRQRTTTKPRTKTGTKSGKKGARVFFADYLAMAREHLTPDVVTVTPAWCKSVTGCSDGTSVKLAAALSAEITTPPTADSVGDGADNATPEPVTQQPTADTTNSDRLDSHAA
jgi:hypothetical protein